ncbi:imidazolonepropionase [bacterium]|nr:imidazolonepropionase [bacterium]
MQIFKNFRLVGADFKGSQAKSAMLVDKGIIQWVGLQSKVPKNLKIKKTIDLKNQLVFPSFIECHTHTVFAGSRAEEFEMRNNGVSYLEIAEKGGGIISTVKATRKASSQQLVELTQKRVDEFLKQGVSTLEIKSGYALDLKNEIKTLEILKKIKGPRIIPTFLGAHARAPEYNSNSEYLEYLAKEVLPVIKKKNLSNRVDIFIENKFFEKAESEKYLKAAADLGFEITIHANQLSVSAGAELALQFMAKSADHMINLNDEIIKSYARSKTVAVLLPTADLYMKCAYPPARKLIDAGVRVALATDYNPGTAPSQDLSLVGLLARLEMKMTLPEVFKAYTIAAAQALGIDAEEGSLEVGKRANFICTESDLSDFFYSAGKMPEHQLFILGESTTTRQKTS